VGRVGCFAALMSKMPGALGAILTVQDVREREESSRESDGRLAVTVGSREGWRENGQGGVTGGRRLSLSLGSGSAGVGDDRGLTGVVRGGVVGRGGERRVVHHLAEIGETSRVAHGS
jgi:hypothetical protein